MDAPLAWLWLQGIAIVGILPVLVLHLRFGARPRWFALGTASWALALVLKLFLHAVLELAGTSAASAVVQGLVGGAVSAGAELGLAAAFLAGRRLRAPDVLAFGAGIGSLEALVLLVPAWAGSVVLGEAAGGWAIVGLALGERAITLVGHVASRILVYASLRGRGPLPFLVAGACFLLVDGGAAYGAARGWPWENPAVHGGFLAFVAAVGAVEVLAAWRWRPRSRPAAAA